MLTPWKKKSQKVAKQVLRQLYNAVTPSVRSQSLQFLSDYALLWLIWGIAEKFPLWNQDIMFSRRWSEIGIFS